MRRIVTVLVVLALAAPAAAEVVVSGDVAAWQELRASQQQLRRLRAYRGQIRLALRIGDGTMEVVNPDRLRLVVRSGPFVVETIVVGSETRYRLGTAAWRCGRPPGMPADVSVPGGGPVEGTAMVRRLPEQTLDGVAMRAYYVVMTIKGRTSRSRQYVAVDTGLPRRAEVLTAGDAVLSVIDYRDFDAPITIDLPACR